MSNSLKNFFWHPDNWCKLLVWAGLFGLTIFFHSDHGFNGDEGIILNGAWNLINKRHLYGDFFEFIPPGSFYLLFGVWKIFGVNFLVAKTLAILFLFLGAVGLYKIARLVIKNELVNILAPLTFVIMSGWWWIINHNIFNLTFLIWSSYFFVRGLDNFKKTDFVASGFLAGVAILFLQQKGLAFFGASFLFLIILAILKKRAVYLRSIGLFVVSSFPPLLSLCFWPLKLIFYNLVQYPFLGYIVVNRRSYGLLIASLILWLVSLLILLATKEKAKKIYFLLFLQLFFLLSAYPLPDFYHISLVFFPFLLIIFYLATRIFNIYRHKFIKIYFIIILVIVLSILTVFNLFVNSPAFSLEENNNHQLIDFVDINCPGRYLYSGPFSPNIYFETRKLNATPYSFLITRQATSEQFVDALRNFREYQPTCAILLYPESFSKFKHDRNNILETYIRDRYSLIYQSLKGDLFVYKNLEDSK